jgi:hypothetical protein
MSKLSPAFPIPLVNLLDKVSEIIQALGLVEMHQLILYPFQHGILCHLVKS